MKVLADSQIPLGAIKSRLNAGISKLREAIELLLC